MEQQRPQVRLSILAVSTFASCLAQRPVQQHGSYIRYLIPRAYSAAARLYPAKTAATPSNVC
jgi:hypothetical protein